MKNYPASHKKFARVYLFYPVFFALFFYITDTPVYDIARLAIVSSLFSIALTELVFHKYLAPKWVIILNEDSFESFSILGERRKHSYAALRGPVMKHYGFITIYLFWLSDKPTQYVAVTDIVENSDECFAELRKRIQEG